MPRPFRIGIPVDPSTGSAVLHASSSLGRRQSPDQQGANGQDNQNSQNGPDLESNSISGTNSDSSGGGGGGGSTSATAMVRLTLACSMLLISMMAPNIRVLLLTQATDCHRSDSRCHPPRLPLPPDPIATQALKSQPETPTRAFQESMEQAERLKNQIQTDWRWQR